MDQCPMFKLPPASIANGKSVYCSHRPLPALAHFYLFVIVSNNNAHCQLFLCELFGFSLYGFI